MSEENPDNKNKEKPKLLLIGGGGSGKTAMVQAIIDKFEKERGIKVAVWNPKDHPPIPVDIPSVTNELPIIRITENDLTIRPIGDITDSFSRFPIKPIDPKLITSISAYNADWSPASGKTERRKRRKNERKLKKLKKSS